MKKSLHLKEANVAVIGVGLMGGSILKSLKKSNNKPKKTIALDINKEVLRKIENLSLSDIVTDNAELAIKDADLLVISLYPAQAIRFIKDNIKHVKTGCIITDICGVKRELMDAVPSIIPEGIAYVGGHPMAGTEHKGFDYSVDNLFTNCKYIIDNSDSDGKELVEEFAYTLGAGKIVESTATNHDEMIAYTSQLPHVLAVAYMLCAGNRNVAEFSAGSFRDVTRVAMINEEMWSELFCENKDMLVDEIKALRHGLAELEDYILKCDTESLKLKMKIASGMREKIVELK